MSKKKYIIVRVVDTLKKKLIARGMRLGFGDLSKYIYDLYEKEAEKEDKNQA